MILVKQKDTVGSTEGRHTLTIVKAEEKKSKNGTNMLVLDMHDEEEGYVRDQVCLEGPGAFRAKQFFAAAGVEKRSSRNYGSSRLYWLHT